MVTDAASAVARLRRRPDRAAILLDFDGTLAPIVDDPETARPLPAIAELLRPLAQRYKVVGVISGRPVAFLQPLLPGEVALAGLYGLEVVRDGHLSEHPASGVWREAVEDVARCSLDRGPEGMVTEAKGLSLTLHYRQHPDAADAVRRWADGQAARSGLVARPARMSVELHPPIKADKGTATESLARGAEAVCFVGDDAGDLPAFDALDRLERQGLAAVRVVIRSDEGPPELAKRADLALDGPSAVAAFLRDLL